MTAPVQEPTQGRVNQAQGFAARQLFRRPAVGGGTPGLAARLSGTTDPISCGGGFGATTRFTFAVDYDNIGLTASDSDRIFTLPASLQGDTPMWGVHGYVNFYAAGDFLSPYQLWFQGPVNEVLYFSDVYYDSSEFLNAGYQSDGFAFRDWQLKMKFYLNGPSDLNVGYSTIDVVYLGQGGDIPV